MNKKRFAAIVLTALVFVGLLFGQGPVQKVRLWDTNLSHSLLLNWNEDRTAGYTLNWIGITADRTITLQGNPTLDNWFDQSVKTTFSPTFVTVKLSVLTDGYVPYHVSDATGLANSVIRTDGTLVGVGMLPTVAQLEVNTSQIITSTTAAPYLKLVNLSNTARDPIIQFAVGATPITRWTHGLDDSLSDDWLLCAGGVLTDTPSAETYEITITYDNYLVISDWHNDRIKKHLASDGTYQAKIGTHGSGNDNFDEPVGTCSDGIYVYITDYYNDRIKKHQLSDLSFVAAFGTEGSGDNQFQNPRGICTDGTYLYIVDTGNNRVKKHLCSDLSYVAQTSGPGFYSPDYICTDGTFIYTIQNPGAGYRIFKHYCYDLSLSLRVMPAGTDGHIDSANLKGVCTTGGHLYLINDHVPEAIFFKYACSDLTYESEFGAHGTGDGEFTNPRGIATDGTSLFVTEGWVGVNARIQKLLLDGTYVFKFGSYGAGDNQFDVPMGICVSGTIVRKILIPHSGPILRAKEDASAIESYVSFHLRDEIRFREDSVNNANYIAIQAPVSVTSYKLILPGATAGAKKNLQVGATDILAWTQNVDTDGAPSFDHLHLTIAIGTAPLVVTSTTAVANLNADLLDGQHAAAFELALGNPGTTGWVLSSTDAGVRSWIAPGGGGADHFVDLLDVPAAYAGAGGKVVKVNAGATGLEFVAGGAGVSSFNDLDDVPASYVGQAGLYAKVKATEDGLEYVAGSGGAPADAKYIVGLANATLSAEKVKAQLYNNYDIDDTPAVPNAMDDEFDDSSLDGKWTPINNPGAPNAISETAFPGYLWIGLGELANPHYYVNLIQAYQAPPGGDGSSAMEFIAKVALANNGDSLATHGQYAAAGIIILNSTDKEYACSYAAIQDVLDSMGQAVGIMNDATADKAMTGMTTNNPVNYVQGQYVYLKLNKTTTAAWTSANTYDAYCSFNGMVWTHLGTCSRTFTHAVDRIGLVFRLITSVAGSPLVHCVVDFFRRTI